MWDLAVRFVWRAIIIVDWSFCILGVQGLGLVERSWDHMDYRKKKLTKTDMYFYHIS